MQPKDLWKTGFLAFFFLLELIANKNLEFKEIPGHKVICTFLSNDPISKSMSEFQNWEDIQAIL